MPAGTTQSDLRARARRWRDLLFALAHSDLQVRYGRGRLRAVRWLLDPLAALGIYLLLVALILDQSGEAVGLSLICAILPFQLVVTTVVNSMNAIQLRRSIIINMEFPRSLIPVGSVVTETVAFTASLTLVPAMMIVYGVEPTWAILWLPVALAVTIALSLALAYPSTLFGIWYPELQPFATSVVRAMFFVAPGLVALDEISGTARDLLPLNPLTGLFESFRDAVLYGQSPAAWELLVPLGIAGLILAVGLPLYQREQRHLAKLVG
jgi:ABC-type polysaccharide/polyol phosphate export permease